jgi:hypothetical protein
MKIPFHIFFSTYIIPRLEARHMIEAKAMIHAYTLLCDMSDPWQWFQRSESLWAHEYLCRQYRTEASITPMRERLKCELGEELV